MQFLSIISITPSSDWYRMDQKPEVKEVKKFDIDAHSARTKTPLPGLRDSDLNQEALPSARHAVKEEYSDYVKLAKSGGHQGKFSSIRCLFYTEFIGLDAFKLQ